MEEFGHQTVLEIFEGPLDLLLYLIRKNEVDIYDIPIQKITEQYLVYLDLMKMLDLDIAGEFLAMAANLMYIKSRLLLPEEERAELEEDEEDPRWELVRQLLEYRQFKGMSERLHEMEVAQEDYYTRADQRPEPLSPSEQPIDEISIFVLLDAFSRVLLEADKRLPAEMEPDSFTQEDGRARVLERVGEKTRVPFIALFAPEESRTRIVVIFLALLHLIQQKVVRVVQDRHFGQIMIEKLEGAVNPVPAQEEAP